MRSADETILLGDVIQKQISLIRISEISESISASYGMSGGRRTKEREDMHYAATIDDLVTRASKNCIANKKHPEEAEQRPPVEPESTVGPTGASAEMPGAGAPRLKVETISISTTGAEASVEVLLKQGDWEFRRSVSGYVIGGKNILRLVAEATAGAVGKSLASGHGIAVDEVALHSVGTEDEIITVVCTFITPRWSTRHVGSAVVRRGDQYRTVASALLAAVNRSLEMVPRVSGEEAEGRDERA